MKTVLAAAVLTLCLAFAGHAAELQPAMGSSSQVPSCIQHTFVRISSTPGNDRSSLGCAQFLSTSRVVQTRQTQRT